ncbi:hypothetical protein LSH36_64g00015 [Paralvinella palmiformis]|uniref:Uncharacterized protein n=1 Tax=Paralvinella palmiformis TaxID=53620 RepID=A0AAD9NBP8_9ANNE|nr:hypothetical protein LSH36_64g00015 [Paralvinella palmiformis]
MYSVYAFLRSGDEIKQIPLASCLAPQKADYNAMFTALLGPLPAEPAVKSLGCVLQKAATFNFCRRLMRLQFLPAEYIPALFEAMEAAGPPPTIGRLLTYYRTQWLENRVLSVASWSVLNRKIRTNNDVEGWHHRFHNMATNQSSLNKYKLIHLLHVEVSGLISDAASCLKRATLSPLLKRPGLDEEEVKGYRPISNRPFISKLIEKGTFYSFVALKRHYSISTIQRATVSRTSYCPATRDEGIVDKKLQRLQPTPGDASGQEADTDNTFDREWIGSYTIIDTESYLLLRKSKRIAEMQSVAPCTWIESHC